MFRVFPEALDPCFACFTLSRSSPCNAYHRSSMGDRRHLWEGVATVLGHCRARLVVALRLRRLWAWGVICGCGEPFGGGGHRLWAWGVICGRGEPFEGGGFRLWAWGVVCGQGGWLRWSSGGCGGCLVVGVIVLMVVVVVAVLVVVVVVLVVVVVVVVLIIFGVMLVVVVVMGVVVVVLLVVVVAVLALWPARCRALLVTWHCHVVVAVVSVYSVGREPLSRVESGGGRGVWC